MGGLPGQWGEVSHSVDRNASVAGGHTRGAACGRERRQEKVERRVLGGSRWRGWGPKLENGAVRRFPLRGVAAWRDQPRLPHGMTWGVSLASGCRANRARSCGVTNSRPAIPVGITEISRGSSEATPPERRPPNTTCTPRGVRERAIWSNRRGPFRAGGCGRGGPPSGRVVEEGHTAADKPGGSSPRTRLCSPPPGPLPRPSGLC